MSLTSLVDEILNEGDEIWIERNGDRVEEIYQSHIIENGYPKIQAESGKTYAVNKQFSGADDFGIVGEDSIYSILEDYGLDGEKTSERVVTAVEDAKKVEYIGEKQQEVPVAD